LFVLLLGNYGNYGYYFYGNPAVVAKLSKRTMFTQVLDRSIEGLNPADRKVVSLSAYDDRDRKVVSPSAYDQKFRGKVRIRPKPAVGSNLGVSR
jgi:hypothetical protein